VGAEVVQGAIDGLARAQRSQIALQPVMLDGVGLVEVDADAFGRRQVTAIAVVGVLLQQQRLSDRQRLDDLPRHRGLAAARAARDADHDPHRRPLAHHPRG